MDSQEDLHAQFTIRGYLGQIGCLSLASLAEASVGPLVATTTATIDTATATIDTATATMPVTSILATV